MVSRDQGTKVVEMNGQGWHTVPRTVLSKVMGGPVLMRKGDKHVMVSLAACCAGAASGHAAAAPPSRVMNSRRFTRSPHRRARATAEAHRGRMPRRSAD